MIAKNKGDFLYNLHNELHRIGIDNDEEIVADFEEHFKESQENGLTEEQTCEKLGDVKEIARNYLDIESTRLNSIIANAMADPQQRVSLTKPGKDLPADLSLVKDGDGKQEQPAIREYTPDHLMEEPETPAPVSPKINLVKEEEAREYTPEHIAAEPQPENAGQAQSVQMNTAQPREYTPQHQQTEQAAQNSQNAGQASQTYYGGIPRQTDERSQNSTSGHMGEIPPQSSPAAGSGKGFKFSDLKGMTPNVNAGKLIGCVCMDVFLWSWLLPMVASLIVGFIGTFVIGLFVGGFSQLANGYLHILSRIFLCSGMVSGAGVLAALAWAMIKGYFKWIKSIVISHIKAVYDL